MAYDGFADVSTPMGLRKRLDQRLKGMRGQRSGWEPIWLEEARFCAPMTSRYLTGYATNGSVNQANVNLAQHNKMNSKLLDTRAVWASGVLANGMHSGLTSGARPWFKLTLGDKDLAKFQEVKEWLDDTEQRIYDFFAKTNFYTALKSGYQCLGRHGVSAAIMESHWRYGGVTHALELGEYWLGVDDGLVVDSLYRRVDMSVRQHYQRFGAAKVPKAVAEAYARGDEDKLFPVYHAIEPNDSRDPEKLDGKNKKFRSVYWSGVCEDAEKGDPGKTLLAEQGYNSKPFWAPRWEVDGNDIYSSTSPGLNSLADVRQLQLGVLRKQQAIDYMIKPPLMGPATLNNVHVSLQPGRVTAMAMVDKDSFRAIWEVDPQALQFIQADNAETREAVDRGFYADLFNAITNMRGVQPRNVEELASRNEEKLTQLGPVTDRVNQEQLQVAIDRAYQILDDANVLLPLPEEMDGVEINVEFISVLAQAQRMIGLGAIERTAGFISSIAGQYPGVLDTFNADEAVAEYGDITGIAAKLLNSPEEIAKTRATRAEQQAQQQQVEQMAAMAPAAKDGAQAASLLFDTPGVGGAPNLASRLLGV